MSGSAASLPQLLMRVNGLACLPAEPELNGVVLRRARSGDEVGLAELLGSCFDHEWTPDGVRHALTENAQVDRVYVAATLGDNAGGERLIATASARLDERAFPGTGYVHWVAVSPDWRGRGLGRAVCIRVLERFRELGLGAAVLETDDHRHAAIRMYLRMGFQPVYRHDADEGRWTRVLDALKTGKE